MSTLVRCEVTLAKNGGVPEILSVVGNANWAGYEIHLWDSATTSVKIGENDGSQEIDRFSLLKTPADLVSCRLVWQGKVRPFGPKPDQPFTVTCEFYQDDIPLTTIKPPAKARGKFTSSFELVVIMCSFKVA